MTGATTLGYLVTIADEDGEPGRLIAHYRTIDAALDRAAALGDKHRCKTCVLEYKPGLRLRVVHYYAGDRDVD